MKTTKIVMGMAAAAVMALTSCVFPGKGLGNVPITTDEKTNTTTKAEVTGTVDFTNTDSSEFASGMQTLQNKKKGIKKWQYQRKEQDIVLKEREEQIGKQQNRKLQYVQIVVNLY